MSEKPSVEWATDDLSFFETFFVVLKIVETFEGSRISFSFVALVEELNPGLGSSVGAVWLD
jgi:hypothetical protein